MKIYISGKKPSKKAERKVKRDGHVPVNPNDIKTEVPIGTTAHKAWQLHMVDRIKVLVDCHGIILLPDWESSKESVLECKIAVGLGLEVIRG